MSLSGTPPCTPEDAVKNTQNLAQYLGWYYGSEKGLIGDKVPARKIFSSFPPEISRLIPTYDSDALIIMTWTARWSRDREKAGSLEVIEINRSFEEFLVAVEKGVTTETNIIARFLNETRSEDSDLNQPSMGLSTFFKALTHEAEDETKYTVRDFIKNLEGIPKKLADANVRWCELSDNWGSLLNYSQDPDTHHDFYQISITPFVYTFGKHGSPHYVVGVRATKPEGISFKIANAQAKWFDLFGVWQLDVDNIQQDNTITEHDFLALQGVLIPVDQRNEVVQSQKRFQLSAQLGAVASRNLSHNIGSHALFHVINKMHSILGRADNARLVLSEHIKECDFGEIQMSTEGLEELEDAAQAFSKLFRFNQHLQKFLSYVKDRSSFISRLGSSGLAFRPIPTLFGKVARGIEEQRLLLENLCGPDVKCSIKHKVNNRSKQHGPLMLEVDSGQIGAHALYIILENFARNSIKHQCRSSSRNSVEIVASVEPEYGSAIATVSVWDDNASFKSDADLEKTVEELNNDVQAAAFAGGYSEGPKGIQEMVAAAAFLFGTLENLASGNVGSPIEFYTEKKRLCLTFKIQISAFTRLVSSVSRNFRLGRLTCFTGEAAQQIDNRSARVAYRRWVTLIGHKHNSPFTGSVARITEGECFTDEIEEMGVVEFSKARPFWNSWLNDLQDHTCNDSVFTYLVINEHRVFSRLTSTTISQKLDGMAYVKVDGLNCGFIIRNDNEIQERRQSEESRVLQDVLSFCRDCSDRENFRVAIWDRHSGCEPPEGSQPPELIHYEEHETDFVLSYDLNNQSSRFMLACTLLEAAYTKILIFDERIFSGNLGTSPKLFERKLRLASLAGLDIVNPQNDWKSVLTFRNQPGPRSFTWDQSAKDEKLKYRYSGMTIHRSVLRSDSRRYREEIGDYEKWIDEFSDLVDSFPYAAYHTGAGDMVIPKGFADLPFIHFSAIEDYVVRNLSKTVFTNIFYTSGSS